MSQHIFQQDEVEVRMGYDRPLNYVFMTVSIRGEIAYTNLDDAEAGTECQDVDYYRDVLKGLQVEVPDEMFTEVKEDQKNRVGNRMKQHRRLLPGECDCG